MTLLKTGRKVRPFLDVPETEVALGAYDNGAIAIMGFAGEDEWYCASVRLAETRRVLQDNEVWLKGWSENEGLPAALEAAGIVTRTGITTRFGYASAELALVDEKLMELWRAHQVELEEEASP